MFSNNDKESILKLRGALGHSGLNRFVASKEGLCRGVAQTAINAFVLEKALEKEDKETKEAPARQDEFQHYLDRIDFILKFYNTLSQLITDTKRQIIKRIEKEKTKAQGEMTQALLECRKISEDERKILEIAILIDNMQLFAYPDKYREFFYRHLTQKDITEISYYGQPQGLEKRSVAIQAESKETNPTNTLLAETRIQSGLILTDTITGVYNQTELSHYLSIILNLLESNPCDLAIGIDNDEHAISLFYDATKKKWNIVDAEHLSERDVRSDELALRISAALPFTIDPLKIFSMKFFTSVNRKQDMEIFLNKLKSNKDFIALHELTLDRALKDDVKGLTLAYLAASENNVSLVTQLCKFKNAHGVPLIDFNRPMEDGTTPLFMAIQNGCAEVLLSLANLRDAHGNRMNLNKVTRYKQTIWNPIFLAAQKNQAEVIKILASLKNPDGTFYIDFNQLIIDESPLFTAAQYGGVDALQVLVNLKMPDGSRLLDVNKAMPDGRTPLFIAVENGQLDAFKLLCELQRPDGTYEIDMNQSLRFGKKALHIAAQEGHLNIINYLRQKNSIDLDEPDNEGLTAAHIAASKNNVDMLLLLDKLGADVEKNISGRKPVDLAQFSCVFTFYQALNKRKELLSRLEKFKHSMNEQDFDYFKSSIMNDFYNDPNKFLKTNQFEERMASLSTTDSESRRAQGFFPSTDSMEYKDTPQQELNNPSSEYQMQLLIEEREVMLICNSSLIIKLEQTSIAPVIWHLTAESEDHEKISIAINNIELVCSLVSALKNKNLPSLLGLLQEQKGRTFRTLSKQITKEIEHQKWEYEQNTAPPKEVCLQKHNEGEPQVFVAQR